MTTLKYTSLFVAFGLLFQPLTAEEETRRTVALWTFEEWNEEAEKFQTIGPIPAEVGSGIAFGWHEDPDTIWRLPVGHGSATGLNANRWSEGDYYEFSISTLGFRSIQLGWNMRRTDLAPEEWLLGYSIDRDNFSILDTFSIGTEEWRTGAAPAASVYSFDLSDVTDLDEQPNLIFRIIAATDASAASGNVRIDNFSVTAIPEPATIGMLVGLFGLGAAFAQRVRQKRKIEIGDLHGSDVSGEESGGET